MTGSWLPVIWNGLVAAICNTDNVTELSPPTTEDRLLPASAYQDLRDQARWLWSR